MRVCQKNCMKYFSRGLQTGTTAEESLRAGKFINLNKVDDEMTFRNAYKYCRRFLGGSWARCSPEQFTVEALSGGMTNYLYLCSLDKKIEREPGEPRKVLIRIYGSIVDQKHIYKLLSEHGNGPRIFSTFPTGQIEEFYPHRTLFRQEMGLPDISRLIARRTAEFHNMDIAVDSTPSFLWDSIEKYLHACRGIDFEGGSDNAMLWDSLKAEMCFETEYLWLRELLLSLSSPVVFCHNDLHGGNMLFIDERNKGGDTDIILIDFDYSSYNYRAFDIANHFCEWTFEYTLGGRDDDGFLHHPNNFPTREQQRVFANEYIAVLGDKQQQQLCAERLLIEVDHFVLASHFLWTLWSVVQAKESNIEFAYLKYARVRLHQYSKKKRELGL